MKKSTKIILAILIILLIPFLVNKKKGSVIEKTTSTTPIAIPVSTPSATPTLIKTSNRMPEEYRKAYINSCKESDSKNTDYCECTMKYLEDHLTNKEILEMSMKYAEDEILPDILMSASFECIHLYNYNN